MAMRCRRNSSVSVCAAAKGFLVPIPPIPILIPIDADVSAILAKEAQVFLRVEELSVGYVEVRQVGVGSDRVRGRGGVVRVGQELSQGFLFRLRVTPQEISQHEGGWGWGTMQPQV